MKLITVLLTLTLLDYSAASQEEDDEHAQHCGMTSSADNTTEYYHCVQCLFPQNCLSNNTCRTGTSGATCEKCLRKESSQNGYHRVGNSCTKCPGLAWPAVALGVFLVLTIIAVVINGFTESVCTKVKLICHFVQYLQLAFHIKVAWPEMLVVAMSVINFGGFNSNIIIPACFFPKMNAAHVHYLEWLSSLALMTLIFLFGKCFDNNMSSLSRSEKSDWGSAAVTRILGKHRKTTLRRFVFLILVVMYSPVAISSLHTFLCSDVIPVELVLDHSRDIYLLDNDVPCATFVFQTIHFFAVLYLLVYVIGLPVMIILLTLRQKKFDLLYSQWTLYGPVYESYKDFFCFGEAVHLLRKFVSVIITDAYPIKPLTQIVAQLGMSGLYLIILLILRPYRFTEISMFVQEECKTVWILISWLLRRSQLIWIHTVSMCVLFILSLLFLAGAKVISTAVVCLVQASAFLVNRGWYKSVLEFVVVIAITMVILLWIVLLFAIPGERQDQVLMEEFVAESEEGEKKTKKGQKQSKKVWFWQSKKVGPDPEFLEKVEERKQHTDF